MVAVDDVEDAVRQAGFLPELGLELDGARGVRRRLEDERVAAGEGDGIDPHRHHDREVERRDPGDDAERLAQGDRVDVGRDVRRVHAGEVAAVAGELDRLDAAHDFGLGIGVGLAVVAGDERGQLVAMLPGELR